MYYIVCDGVISNTQDKRPTQSELQKWADDTQCECYVIQGQHGGMTAYPEVDDEANTESSAITAGDTLAGMGLQVAGHITLISDDGGEPVRMPYAIWPMAGVA